MFVTLSLCLLVRDSLYTEFLVVLVFGTRHQSLGPEIVDIDSACTPSKVGLYHIISIVGNGFQSIDRALLYPGYRFTVCMYKDSWDGWPYTIYHGTWRWHMTMAQYKKPHVFLSKTQVWDTPTYPFSNTVKDSLDPTILTIKIKILLLGYNLFGWQRACNILEWCF